MQVFDANDILKVAVNIEENGEQFYRYAVGLTEDKETKELFEYLANEEVNHQRTFQDLLSKMPASTPRESYPGEYLAYIQSYTDKIIFTKEELEEKLPEIKDILSAIDFAIQRELDSILYYHEMKNFVSEHQHRSIDQIINEERKHFSNLATIKEKYK
jgi:rubrerythrin